MLVNNRRRLVVIKVMNNNKKDGKKLCYNFFSKPGNNKKMIFLTPIYCTPIRFVAELQGIGKLELEVGMCTVQYHYFNGVITYLASWLHTLRHGRDGIGMAPGPPQPPSLHVSICQ